MNVARAAIKVFVLKSQRILIFIKIAYELFDCGFFKLGRSREKHLNFGVGHETVNHTFFVFFVYISIKVAVSAIGVTGLNQLISHLYDFAVKQRQQALIGGY